jgi:hypothetical protein
MTIEILSTQTHSDPLTGETSRTAAIVITSGGDSYLWQVGGLPAEGDLQAILEAREAELLAAAIAAGVIPNAPEVGERLDFAGLLADIAGELAWLTGAQTAITSERAEIVTGITVIDGGATLAQLRQVVRGFAVILDNTLQRQNRLTKEQEGELKAWRFVIRRLS